MLTASIHNIENQTTILPSQENIFILPISLDDPIRGPYLSATLNTLDLAKKVIIVIPDTLARFNYQTFCKPSKSLELSLQIGKQFVEEELLPLGIFSEQQYNEMLRLSQIIDKKLITMKLIYDWIIDHGVRTFINLSKSKTAINYIAMDCSSETELTNLLKRFCLNENRQNICYVHWDKWKDSMSDQEINLFISSFFSSEKNKNLVERASDFLKNLKKILFNKRKGILEAIDRINKIVNFSNQEIKPEAYEKMHKKVSSFLGEASVIEEIISVLTMKEEEFLSSSKNYILEEIFVLLFWAKELKNAESKSYIIYQLKKDIQLLIQALHEYQKHNNFNSLEFVDLNFDISRDLGCYRGYSPASLVNIYQKVNHSRKIEPEILSTV